MIRPANFPDNPTIFVKKYKPYVVNMVNVKSVAKPGSPYAIALAGDILFILLAFLIFFFHSCHSK